MKNIRFVRWIIDKRPSRFGHLLCKGIFEDREGNQYDWVPKTEDLMEGVGQVKATSNINKINIKNSSSESQK